MVAIGQTLLMMSLAEYCSLWPTAGGQQYYIQALSSGKLRPILSYLVGWMVMVGEISTGSSCALNSAQLVASFVQITYPDLRWHSWETWLLYCAFVVVPMAYSFKQSWLPYLNIVGGAWTILGGVAWAVVFGVMAPKHDAKFIFTKFINNTGYSSNGWVFIMSFYNSLYGLYGTDGTMHLVRNLSLAEQNLLPFPP